MIEIPVKKKIFSSVNILFNFWIEFLFNYILLNGESNFPENKHLKNDTFVRKREIKSDFSNRF